MLTRGEEGEERREAEMSEERAGKRAIINSDIVRGKERRRGERAGRGEETNEERSHTSDNRGREFA